MAAVEFDDQELDDKFEGQDASMPEIKFEKLTPSQMNVCPSFHLYSHLPSVIYLFPSDSMLQNHHRIAELSGF